MKHGAQFLGFVHFPPSPRHVDVATLAKLVAETAGRAKTVIVTVNPDDALLDAVFAACRARGALPDFVQLHGDETPARCAEVRARYGVGIIKGLGVAEAADLADAAAYETAADMLLLDAKPPKNAARPGGLGHAFDWEILRQATLPHSTLPRTLPLPWFLSGGLTPENVADAIAHTGARYVDVSSGVESAPGLKDPERIRAFLEAIR